MVSTVGMRPEHRPNTVDGDEDVAVPNTGFENIQPKDEHGTVVGTEKPTAVEVIDEVGWVLDDGVEKIGRGKVQEVDVEGSAKVVAQNEG